MGVLQVALCISALAACVDAFDYVVVGGGTA